MNDQPVQPWTPQVAYSETSELTILLAKILTLVAPTSMTTEQQEVWLRAAIDALQDIRVVEVRSVMLELQRSVQRPSQIVPELSKLVAAKRARSSSTNKSVSPFMAEREINLRGQELRAKAHTQREVNDIHDWERSARLDASLAVAPVERPLTNVEIERMPAHIVRFAIECGFLKHQGDTVVEVMNPDETDRIREANRRS